MDTLVVCWGQDIEWRTEKREREKKRRGEKLAVETGSRRAEC